MSKTKQVIVIRKDLNMRKGKMISQGAHASLKAVLDLMHSQPNESSQGSEGNEEWTLFLDGGSAIHDWINGIFTKICLSVDSEQELLDVYNKAKEKGLICSLIQDAGITEFGGVPTYTCCAIGPCFNEEVQEITGHLKLL
jgi:PTH2 family peptidyl-tRNA hydrolase